jgi:hypothetical protein
MKQQCDISLLLPFVTHEPDWLYRNYLVAKVVFLGAFAKLLKVTIRLLALSCPSVRPFVPIEHIGSHWTDFYEIC